MTKKELDIILGKALENGDINTTDTHIIYACFLFTQSKLKSHKAELQKRFGSIFFKGMEKE